MIDIKVLASGSKGNCYRISDGKSSLLLDAGIPCSKISAGCGYRLSEISGCLITHIHIDHSKAAADLPRRGVPVYGPADIKHSCTELARVLEPMQPCGIGTFNVTPFIVPHDTTCYGYKITSIATGETLVYITDAGYFPFTFPHVDYWMIESNYSEEILIANVTEGIIDYVRANRVTNTHMSIEQVVRYFTDDVDASGAKQIWLLHLSNDNSDAENFRSQIEEVTGAEVHIA